MIGHRIACVLLLACASVLRAEDASAGPGGSPAVERLAPEQWCWTHDLPKSVCAACDRRLIPALRKARDWCPEHGRAESVCVICDPGSKAALDALRPAGKPAGAP